MSKFWSSVKGFQPISLCDWPGKVSAVLFIAGCNLRCPTCHNKELAFFHKKLSPVPREEVLSYLKKRKGWIDGIVISGGEPTLIDLEGLITELKKEVGLPIKVDTNGMRPEVVKNLVKKELVDLFAVDIKGPWNKYPELTGGRCDFKSAENKIKEIIELAKKNPSKFYFRITKVPLLNDEDIKEVEKYLPKGFKLNVQKFIDPDKKYSGGRHVY